MTEASPRLTVGLPVYNGEDYIDQTLEAVRAQTMDDLVVFVADNASTDGTREIVEHHAAADNRIILDVATENRGASFNWNRCFAQATTPFFTWICADDIPLPDKYGRGVEMLEQDAHAVLAYPGTEIIDSDGQVTGPFEDMGALVEPTPAGRLERILRDLVLVNSLFGVLRTEVLKDTRGMMAFNRADTVLLGELALRGTFRYDPEIHFQRRIHDAKAMEGSDADIAAHYTGSADIEPPSFPFGKVLQGHLQAIHQAPLSRSEKVQALRALRRWRYRKRFLAEVGRGARTNARRLSSRLRRS